LAGTSTAMEDGGCAPIRSSLTMGASIDDGLGYLSISLIYRIFIDNANNHIGFCAATSVFVQRWGYCAQPRKWRKCESAKVLEPACAQPALAQPPSAAPFAPSRVRLIQRSAKAAAIGRASGDNLHNTIATSPGVRTRSSRRTVRDMSFVGCQWSPMARILALGKRSQIV
jgi:hypothetical protein